MRETIAKLVRMAPAGRGRFALSIALGVAAIAFGIALMTTAGYLISRSAERPEILSLTVVIVGVRFFGIARPLTRYLQRLASHDVALRSLGEVRANFYRRIEPLAPVQLGAYRSGELLGRMVGDVDALQNLYLRGLSPPLIALIAGIAAVGFATWLLPVAGLALAVGLILDGVVLPAIAATWNRSAGRRRNAARAELSADLVETLRGGRELLLYGRDREAVARIEAHDRELASLGRREAFVSGASGAISVLIAGLTTVAVLVLAISAHDSGSLDHVLIATLALLTIASFEATSVLADTAQEMTGTLSAGRRVLELTEEQPLIEDAESPAPCPAVADVELRDVTARYPGSSEPVFEDLGVRVDSGRRVALVGPSGAGKSTIAALLLRFLDPASGAVTIGGTDLRSLAQSDVRATYGLAGQDAHVFSSTIRANLQLARPDAEESRLWSALEAARLADWVRSLPDGLDTFVGEAGEALSGGQRQRLIVARALLGDAPVLLLDEPTAHLDEETAQELIDDVFTAAGDRSIVLITHRREGLEQVAEVISIDG